MKETRTTNTIFNFISSMGTQFITIIMQFIVRTVFINTLGASYLGIDGLFSNILSMLSLAELGVGGAILFKLYTPIAKKDNRRISILINFYKQVYFIIGIVITVIGFFLIPFLPLLIKDYNQFSVLGINLILIYVIYLLESASSYLFFAYKSALIRADQKEYLLNVINFTSKIIFSILQIITLVLLKNFVIYVIISVVQVIFQNVIGALLANKMYPYIKEKSKDKIEKSEIKDILKDCTAIFLYKINGVIINSTDYIVISAFLGISMVGMYSNYYIFYTSISAFIGRIYSSVSNSLGNLHVYNEYNTEYKIFKSINLISVILGATGGIGILCVADEFIENWIGSNWIISQPFSLLMGIEIYTLSIRNFIGNYRNAMGLFQQAKYRPIIAAIINIIVSVLLVRVCGIYGVLIGTIVADWTTFMWYDPLIIHKYGLKNKFATKFYYLRNLKYIITAIIAGAISLVICNNVLTGLGWISIIFHAIVCIIIVPLSFVLVSLHTEEENYLLDKIKEIFLKIKNRRKRVSE